MEVEYDVMNSIVNQVLGENPINVKHMEAETDVQIVLIGSIPEVDVQNMMDTVQLVSSVFSQMITVVRYIFSYKRNYG